MIQDLIPNDSTHLKALFTPNRVYNHVAMDPDEMLAIKYRILVLSGRINDLDRKVLVLVPDNFGECVLYRRVVRVDKVAINILNRQGALACHVLRYVL